MVEHQLLQAAIARVEVNISVTVILVTLSIALLVQLALAASVAEEASGKGYRYSDYFWSAFFLNFWAARALVRSLPHKSHWGDKPIAQEKVSSPKRFGRNKTALCYNCSTPMLDDADFCGECGAKQTSTKPAKTPTMRDAIACRTCGTVCAGTANYCSSCGNSLREAPTQGSSVFEDPTSKPQLTSLRDDDSNTPRHPGTH